MKRLNVFTQFPYVTDADESHWMKLIYRNFDKTVRILVEFSNDLKCLICDDLSLNFKSRSSLANHYYVIHKTRTAKFFLDRIMTKKLEELLDE